MIEVTSIPIPEWGFTVVVIMIIITVIVLSWVFGSATTYIYLKSRGSL